jgi:gliding motility-associated-like protein
MKRIANIWFSSVVIMLSLHAAVLTGQTDTICFNDTILYNLPNHDNSEYNWIISGGTIIYASTHKDSVIVVWNESTGLYSVEVTRITENSCTSEPEKLYVFVNKLLLDLGSDITICEGSNEVLTVEPDFAEYFWNDQPGTNEFIVSTAGTVSLEVKDKHGCRAADSINVIVNEHPEPDFIANVDTIDRLVTLINLSDSTWQYHWDFGDGTFSDDYNPGVHSYSGYGTYEITLTATTDDCSGTTSHVVHLVDPVKADFRAVYEGCAPVEVTFINLSTGADNYYWDFGNGNSSTDENPTTLYNQPGIYQVTLYARKDTILRISKSDLAINESPVADFEANPTEAHRYNEIRFINNSSGAINYFWNFGDGDSSDLFEPAHSYSSAGKYDVTLLIWSANGCNDSLTVTNAISIIQDCRILFPSGFIPNKNGPGGGYYNPAQKTDNNEIFHPIYEDINAYELKIYNRWGEVVFISRDIDYGWDGYYNGKLAPQDTYLYEAKSKCPTGEELTTTGSVTLIY